MATPAPNKNYKRSWKNLLLNKRYQLQFTLFMVGLSAVLMAVLGIWVMKEANEATTVAMSRLRGTACDMIPAITESTGDDDDSGVPMKLDGSDAELGSAAMVGSGSAAGSDAQGLAATMAAPKPVHSAVDPKDVAKHNAMDDVVAVGTFWCSDAACKPGRAEPLLIKTTKCDDYVKHKLEDPVAVAALRKALVPVVTCEGGQTFSVADAPQPEHHVKVQLDESSMTLTAPPPAPPLPPDYADRVVMHWSCEMKQMGSIDILERGRMRILWVLIITGLALMMGLAVYGIKMTHKVAGPLFKVSLYLAKMREGRFDKVWNLRKGDQLVDFYEHFKSAHAGVVKLERDDIDQIKALIAAAESAGAGDHDTVTELKALLARKEKALE